MAATLILTRQVNGTTTAYKQKPIVLHTANARIETIALTFDGKPMLHWSDAIEALGFHGTQHTSTSSLAGEVIPPSLNRETAIEALRVNQRELAAAIKQNATRFGMDICYCSVYDDCWVAHWLKPKPDPVERCEASPDKAFDD